MTAIKNTIWQDLLAVMKEMTPVRKDAKNPYFNSDYTTLDTVLRETRKLLEKHNFILLQPITSDENGVYVETTLVHVPTGEKISSRMRIVPAKDADPQAQGSAITYARRYSLKSLLAMSDEDDDAEKAMGRDKKQQVRQQVEKARATSSVMASEKQVKAIFAIVRSIGKDEEWLKKLVAKNFGVDSIKKLPIQQASQLIDFLKKKEMELKKQIVIE